MKDSARPTAPPADPPGTTADSAADSAVDSTTASAADSAREPPAGGPEPTPFDRLGGEPAVRALVDRFYDLMDLEPAFAELRALHPSELDGSRDKLHWFLCGWLGGPSLYIERFGHPRLRARHLPFAIGIRERDQWMACMMQAMQEQQVEPTLAERLTQSLFGTADWMRNKGG